MAVSLFAKFYKVKDTQAALESDSALLALPLNTVIQCITGDEFVKVGANVFDKTHRDLYSQVEADGRFFRLHFENVGTENNTFTKNVDVQGTLSAGNLKVSGETQLRKTSATDITANNVTLTANITSPNGTINTLKSNTIIPLSNMTGTVGTSASTWATAYIQEMYGTAQHARYSDLAEKYKTDEVYPEGTVLEFKEDSSGSSGYLTKFKGGTLAGAVSTKPGLKINSDGEGQYVCLKGMIPVIAKGEIKQGQYCIAEDGAVYGCAKRDLTPQLMLDIVGVALEDSCDGKVMVKV